MDRDTKLKEFAAALFSHVFREYNTIFDLPVKLPHVFSHHPPHDSSGEEAAAVLRLCLALRGVFNGLFVTSFETFQQSTEQFMTFLTSRALRLCSADDGDDVFLAFCMVCAFIAELNLFCIINGCFAFMSTAPKCLQAIFNRRLRKEFFASGGWEALKCWSEHFAGNVLPEEVVSDDLLESIKKKLTEVASSSSSDEEEEDEEEEDLEEEPEDTDDDDEEGEDKPKEPEEAKADGPSNQSNPGTSNSQPSAVISSDEEDSDEISSESESDSEEDEEESKPTPRANGQKRPHVDTSDDDSEEDSEQEVRHNGVTKRTKVSEDDESDSEEEEESDETSSMSEEDSEGESEEDSPVKEKVQTNSVKPIVQGNVTADKEVL